MVSSVPDRYANDAYSNLNSRLNTIENQMASVKVATPDIINLLDDETPEDQKIEIMTDLLFEDIAAQEIVNIIRNDIVNGQSVIYQPIKNITGLYYQYNPQNILALQKTDKDYFKNFPILLYSKVPQYGSGPDFKYVFIDETSGNLIIDLINMKPGEEVEVQFISNLEELHDTIY